MVGGRYVVLIGHYLLFFLLGSSAGFVGGALFHRWLHLDPNHPRNRRRPL